MSGMVIFGPPDEGGRTTVHRIVKLTVRGGTTSITWGEANTVAAFFTLATMIGIGHPAQVRISRPRIATALLHAFRGKFVWTWAINRPQHG
jgi:hypothetical protein